MVARAASYVQCGPLLRATTSNKRISPREEPRRRGPLFVRPQELTSEARCCSLLAQGLGLGIELLALSLLPIDGHETLQVEGLACLLDAVGPDLDAGALVALLGHRRRLLGDNLAELVAHQLVLGHAAEGLLLAPTQHLRSCELAPGDLGYALGLHAPGALHGRGHLHRQSHDCREDRGP